MRSNTLITRLAFLTVLGTSIAAGADIPGNNVPENYVERRRAFMRLLTEGQNEHAYEAIQFEASRRLTPLQQADALDLAAQLALRMNRNEEALRLAERIELKPYQALAKMRVFSNSQRTGELLKLYGADDLKQYPDSIVGDVAAMRGAAWMIAKDGAKAEQDLLLAESYATDQNLLGEILLRLGTVYAQLLNDDAKAIAAWRVYGTNNEFKQSTAAVGVARLLLKQGLVAEAKAELERIDEAKITIPVYRDALLKAKAAVLAPKQP